MTPSHTHALLLVLDEETSPTVCLHLKIIMWEKLSDIQKEDCCHFSNRKE